MVGLSSGCVRAFFFLFLSFFLACFLPLAFLPQAPVVACKSFLFVLGSQLYHHCQYYHPPPPPPPPKKKKKEEDDEELDIKKMVVWWKETVSMSTAPSS